MLFGLARVVTSDTALPEFERGLFWIMRLDFQHGWRHRIAKQATRTLVLIAFAALGFWAYLPTLQQVWDTWGTDPEYTHGYFVVPLSLCFLWVRRDRLPELRTSFLGLLLMAAAAGLRWGAGRFYFPAIDAWSIPLWLGGIIWATCGWTSVPIR